MNLIRDSRLLRITGLLLGALVWLANNLNPPTGRTGAPFDGHCNNCHGGSNPGGYDGSVTITGMPSSVEPNTLYPLVITMTPTSGSPVKGGFQLVAVDGNNANAGNLAAGNAQSGTEFLGGREYLEHRSGKNFAGGGPISWNFNWTSPTVAAGNTIKFFFIGNFCNGNNGDGGDWPIAFSETYSFIGPPPLTAVISNTTNVSCFGGNNGSATVDATGGLAPYTYLWSFGGQTTQTAVNLPAGTYTVTVTGSNGTGTTTASATITQPAQLNATASSSGTITCAQPSVILTGNATGGVAPYEYQWSDGQSGKQISVSTPGTIVLTVTDNNGCTKVTSVNVASNTVPPTATIAAPPALTCAQPSIQLNATGSSAGPNFNYLWTATNGGNIVSGANTLTPTVNAAGTFVFKVTNTTNGCMTTASVNVVSNINLPTATTSAGVLNCNNTSTNVSVSTNASPASYQWSGPNNFTSNQPIAIVAVPGNYFVTVTNTASGCFSTATAVVTQNTTAPNVSASGGHLTCATTNITLTATSVSTAKFAWSGPNAYTSTLQNPVVNNPGDYYLTVTDTLNGCIALDTAIVTQNITPPTANASATQLTCTISSSTLSVNTNANPATFQWSGPNNYSSDQQNPSTGVPGTYNVVVQANSNGCTAAATTTVVQNITPPTASASTPGNLNCNTASIQLNGSASSQGTGFSYLWTTSNGNIVSGENSLTPVVNKTGLYTLVVNNSANGCTATTSVSVNQTPPVTATINNVVNVACNGGSTGSATVVPGGGAGTYAFVWSNNTGQPVANNLSAGAYTVSVTDGDNCTATANVLITQPNVLIVNASATGETAAGANNGTATAAPTGGTSPYTYLWNNNQTAATITNLAPGNYSATVNDANGCIAVQSVTVNSFNCSLSASLSLTNVTCNGNNNGTATVNLTGAALPAAFQWSNGDQTAVADSLAPGTYTVQITDANNCPALLTVNITEPPTLFVNATATNETALNANDGTAAAQPTGGISPYTFAWSNMQTTPTISNLAPGQYTVNITDANGCTAAQTVTVNGFNCTLTSSISIANVSCAGGNNGQATVTINGGALPFNYNWSNNNQTPTASSLAAGTYSVTVVDANACILTISVTITEPAPLGAQVTGLTNVICPEAQTGSATVTATGGTSPYQYAWPNGLNGQNLGVGNYVISVTDDNGCTTSATVIITSNDNVPPTLSCPPNAENCLGETVFFPQPVVQDNCNLNGAQATQLSGPPSGSVFPEGESALVFQAVDASGNTGSCFFSITVFAKPDVTLGNVLNDVGNAGVGSIFINVGGKYQLSWEKNGQFFSDAEDLTGLNAGVYVLTAVDTNGCSTKLPPVEISNTVGTGETLEDVVLRIVPNPADQSFHLDMKGPEPMAVHLLDVHGRSIRQLTPEEWSAEVNVSHLPGGLYYLRIITALNNGVMIKWLKM